MAPKPTDQDHRDKARFTLDRNIVVEAGAGTGKTTLLVDRYLALVLAGGEKKEGLRVEEIVALTFTEKAAGEMRTRVTQRLMDILALAEGRRGEAAEPERAEAFIAEADAMLGKRGEGLLAPVRLALEEMDRARIGTIHAFAAFLLRLFPLQAGVDPAFEVDSDGGLFDEIFEAEWTRWLERELGEEPPGEAGASWKKRETAWRELLTRTELEDLKTLAASLSRDDVRQGPGGRAGANKEVLAKLGELAVEGKRLADACPKKKGGLPYALEAGLRAAVENLENFAEEPVAQGRLPDFLPRASLKAAGAKDWRLGEDGSPEKRAGYARYKAIMKVAGNLSSQCEAFCRKGMEQVAPLVETVTRRLNARGVVSFHGLLVKARDLLRENRGAREKLKRRFGAILVDEFQDTDPVQGEILLYLAEERGRFARARAEVRFEPGKLFIVGDPKQSIYRFRGADMRAYHDYVGLLKKQEALECRLTASFRAHAGVLGPVNEVFGARGLMAPEAGLQPEYTAISPRPEAKGAPRAGGLEVVCIGAGPDPVTAELAREREAAFTVEWLGRHCSPKPDGPAKPGPGRFFFGEAAVLVRRATQLGALVDALKEADLPFVVDAEQYFYETQEVVDFLNLLRILDDPRDRSALAGLLRSPLVCIDDAELLAMSRAKALTLAGDAGLDSAGLSPAALARVRAFYAQLERLRALVGKVPLGELVSRILADTFLVDIGPGAYQGDQTAGNLIKFARLAGEAGRASGETLKEFIARLKETMAEGAREGESPLADETLDAVRIMTIHRAKGLEFPVVILPDLAAGPGGGGEPDFVVDWATGTAGLRLARAKVNDAAFALIRAEETSREEREAVRVLYVAMTRAKEHMVLLGNASPRVDREESFSGLLRRAGAWPEKGTFPDELVFSGGNIPIVWLKPEAPPSQTSPAKRKEPEADPDELGIAWAARARRCAEVSDHPAIQSPSRLAEEMEKRELDEEQAAALERASLVGQICHRVLEGWDYKEAGPVSGKGALQSALNAAVSLVAKRSPQVDIKPAAAKAKELLQAFLGSAAAKTLAGVDILAREIPFVCEWQGATLRGFIDLLYRDPDTGELVVADYKTVSVKGKDAAEVATRYLKQGEAYAEAVRRATGEKALFKVVFLASGELVSPRGGS